jgi:hypothetical protein
MKTITGMILLLAITLLPACQGIPGEDGLDGDSILGTVFEIEGDFTPANEWMLYFKFPNTIEIFESDAVLVYILWEQANNLDVWRLLPQTVVLPEGILQYNYDFTLADVQIFLDGSLDLNTLLPAESQDQVFRIVVLPADFALYNPLDVSNYDLLVKSLGLDKKAVEKVK